MIEEYDLELFLKGRYRETLVCMIIILKFVVRL